MLSSLKWMCSFEQRQAHFWLWNVRAGSGTIVRLDMPVPAYKMISSCLGMIMIKRNFYQDTEFSLPFILSFPLSVCQSMQGYVCVCFPTVRFCSLLPISSSMHHSCYFYKPSCQSATFDTAYHKLSAHTHNEPFKLSVLLCLFFSYEYVFPKKLPLTVHVFLPNLSLKNWNGYGC